MTRENLMEYVLSHLYNENETDVVGVNADNIVFLLDNLEITVPQDNRFFVQTNARDIQLHAYYKRAAAFSEQVETENIKNGIITRAYTGLFDFGHTSPVWEDILRLGIYGLRNRLLDYHQKTNNSQKQRFYSACIKVYDASLRFLQKASQIAREQGKTEMADGLYALSSSVPQNFYQRLQTVFIFFNLQQCIDGTFVRTLGRLDSLFYPYFIQEDREVVLRLIEDFIKEIDTLQVIANIPFAIGGTDKNGNSLVNPLSYIILDTYGKLNTVNTKFHILYSDNMPDDLVKRAFEYIRAGKNSIVFMSDKTAIEGLKNIGAAHEDACNYHVVGCYECGAEGEIACTCNARVNIPKALELTLNGGTDVYTGIALTEPQNEDFVRFEDLYEAFEKTLLLFVDRAIQATNDWEKLSPMLHSSPFLSSTYLSALEKGGDLYCDFSAKYNNSSLNAIGLATAVDSLIAIKQLVYDERKYTLGEFIEILKSDWKNNEILRLRIKNNFPKFGAGNTFADGLAKHIIERLSEVINGRPNVKGGVWRLGTFSIDWRWDFGKHTHATANGRKAGETLSQNTSASFGADKEGATAHLLSVSAFPHTHTPNGSIADIDLHSSAVRGENGITALYSTLKTYFERGGLAVHYNVLDTETLKKAKQDPSAYPNLQVRLCGWNVLFSSLSEKEKDEFIARSIKEENV